jgi:hypothetical protein
MSFVGSCSIALVGISKRWRDIWHMHANGFLQWRSRRGFRRCSMISTVEDNAAAAPPSKGRWRLQCPAMPPRDGDHGRRQKLLRTVGPRFGDVPMNPLQLTCGACGSRRCRVIAGAGLSKLIQSDHVTFCGTNTPVRGWQELVQACERSISTLAPAVRKHLSLFGAAYQTPDRLSRHSTPGARRSTFPSAPRGKALACKTESK